VAQWNTVSPVQPFYQPPAIQEARAMPIVLIVDDDHFIANLLAQLLLESGLGARVVYNAEDAFAVAAQEQPALMLIDFMMPGGNGDALIRRLQEDALTHPIPLALMSSARPKLPEMEGIPFLPKPFDNDDLLEFIRCHMRASVVD
jgi:two-component system phosphate regulon response regulator PhoB